MLFFAVEAAVDFREIENALQVERVVDVEVDPEERIGFHREEVRGKNRGSLDRCIRWGFDPERLFVVDVSAVEIDREREESCSIPRGFSQAVVLQDILVLFVDQGG